MQNSSAKSPPLLTSTISPRSLRSKLSSGSSFSYYDPDDEEESSKFNRQNVFRNSISACNRENDYKISSKQYGQIRSKTSIKMPDFGTKIENLCDDKRKHSFQWIEIIEPKSQTKMFANLET